MTLRTRAYLVALLLLTLGAVLVLTILLMHHRSEQRKQDITALLDSRVKAANLRSVGFEYALYREPRPRQQVGIVLQTLRGDFTRLQQTPTLRGQAFNGLWNDAFDSLLAAERLLAGLSPQSNEILSERNRQSVRLFVQHSETLGITLDQLIRTSMEQDSREQDGVQSLIYGGLALKISLSLAAVWLLRRYVLKPLSVITQAAATVGQGNLETRVQGNGTGEWALLTHTFNSMLDHLQTMYHRLQEDERRTAAIIAAAQDGIVLVDTAGIIRLCNPALEQMFGYAPQELIGQPIERLVPGALREAHVHRRNGLLAKPQARSMSADIDLQGQRRDGRLFSVDVSLSPLSLDGQAFIQATVRDLTERKASLERELQNVRLLIQQAPIAIAMFDRDMIYMTCSDQWLADFGRGASSLVGRSHYDLYPDIPEEWKVVHERGMAGENVRNEADPWIQADGSTRWLRWAVSPWRLGDTIGGILIMAEDISTRMQMLGQLRDQTARLGLALEAAHAGVWQLDVAQGRYTQDSRIKNWLHLPEDSRQGWPDFVCAEDAAKVALALTEAVPLADSTRVTPGDMAPEATATGTDSPVPSIPGNPLYVEFRLHEADTDATANPARPQRWLAAIGEGYGDTLYGVLQDITARKQAEADQQADQARFEATFEQAAVGIALVATDGRWLRVNDKLCQIVGYPREALLRLTFQDITHPDDLAADVGQVQEVLRGSLNHYALEKRYLRKSGEPVWVNLSVSLARRADGTPDYFIAVVEDIDARKQLEQERNDYRSQLENKVQERTEQLHQAVQVAESASQAKSQFLANMSHEIRTPMNAVLGMLELTCQTALTPRQQDYIGKAQTAARSLLGLLNDILDFSKIEAGRLQLDVHPFGLETLFRDLGAVLSGNHTHPDVEVIFDIDPTLPGQWLGDALRLQQILINLAGNALKFTLHGQVVVRVAGLQADTASENGAATRPTGLRFSVSDTGIGISPEQRARIFESFTQAEVSTTRRFGGTGLGLVICKRLISLMGSTLELESELGRGSRFWFDVQLPVADPVPLTQHCPGNGTALRALATDDNPQAAEVLRQFGEALGWQMQIARSGAEAVARVRQARMHGPAFDVVLMDWRMPEIDGLQAARQINHLPGGHPPPVVIMVTAHGREVLIQAQEEPDPPFVDFLVKPLTPQQMADVVDKALHGGSLQTPRPLPSPPPPPQTQRLAGLRVLVVEDNAVNRQIADELLRLAGAEVTLAEGGLRGVTLVLNAAQSFDAVLMDMQMPDIDGLEATLRIRADGRFAHLPIVAMTANASLQDREDCLAVGMNDHIAKPISLAQLVTVLCQHTGRSLAGDVSATPRGDEALVESPAAIARRFGDKMDIYTRLLAMARPDLEGLLADFAHQVAQLDAQRARAVLHTLKGNAATYGAEALARQAGALEATLKEDGAARVLTPASVAQLQDLTARSLQALEPLLHTISQASEALPAAEPPPPLSPAQWQARLQELLPLLAAANLRALDLAATLPAPPLPHQAADFARLQAELQALDYTAAQATVRGLLG